MITTPQKRNNDGHKKLTLSEIARLIDGKLMGDPGLVITGVAGIKEAEKGDITFLSNAKYLPFLSETKASAVIVGADVVSDKKPTIQLSNPSSAFSKVVSYFMSQEDSGPQGIHPTSVIANGVTLGENVTVGPLAVLEEGSVIGARTYIGAGCYIGSHARVGNDSRLYPQVVIRERVQVGNRVIIHSKSVIGSDGFGYETIDGKHLKIPQLGSVLIEDDVEIGSCTCVDRGRFRNTIIGKGTKIDNLVQIAHNVVLGQDCLIISQAGISGSTELGNRVVVAGQAGIVGHVTLGDDVIVAARSGVSKSVPEKMVVLGEPARPIQEQKRLFALIARLPELFKEFAEFKKKNQ